MPWHGMGSAAVKLQVVGGKRGKTARRAASKRARVARRAGRR